jgi:hypothetical protein
VKPKEQKSKRTYSKDELNQLLLKEAFERDFPLFASMLQERKGFFEEQIIQKDWTFTVVKDNASGNRELFINVPSS